MFTGSKKMIAFTKASLILTLLIGVSLSAVHAESRRKTMDVKEVAKKETTKEQNQENENSSIGPKFHDAEDFSEGLALVRPGRQSGFINKKGEYVVEPQFKWGTKSFSEGLAVVVRVNGKYGYINTKGEMVIQPQYDQGTSSFSEGLAAVKINGKYGYIDKKGEVVIQPQFYNNDNDPYSISLAAKSFSEGLAAVMIDGRWGYIDKKGEMVIKPEFDAAYAFSDGVARIHIHDKDGDVTPGYINKEGKTMVLIWPADFEDFSEGLGMVKINGRFGFKNTEVRWAIQPQFDDAESFSEGLAAVKIDKKWGFIDKKGKTVIKPQFDDVSSFSEGLAAVYINKKVGFINKKGKMIIQPQFSYFRAFKSFFNGMAKVQLEDKWLDKYGLSKFGYINKKGEVLIRFQFNPDYCGRAQTPECGDANGE